MSAHVAPVTSSTIIVAVDVGKTSAVFSVTGSGLSATVARAGALAPPEVRVKVGVEAAGHYHRPVLEHRWVHLGRTSESTGRHA